MKEVTTQMETPFLFWNSALKIVWNTDSNATQSILMSASTLQIPYLGSTYQWLIKGISVCGFDVFSSPLRVLHRAPGRKSAKHLIGVAPTEEKVQV